METNNTYYYFVQTKHVQTWETEVFFVSASNFLEAAQRALIQANEKGHEIVLIQKEY